MTTTAQALRAGPLAGQDLSLLKAGSSVVRTPDGSLVGLSGFSPDGVVDEEGDFFISALVNYIGDRGPDGWISAPVEGWASNPVPGTWVETRYPNLSSQQGPSEYIHDWTLVGSFRVAPPTEGEGIDTVDTLEVTDQRRCDPAQQDSQPFVNRWADAKPQRPVEDPSALVPFGWAPGGYFCTECPDCKQPFEGDKRCRRCQDCAEALAAQPAPSQVGMTSDARNASKTAQQDNQQGAGGEVKPCPFCGSKDILEREIDTTGGPYVWFACMDCGAESSGDDGREDALDQWNRRHPSGHTGGPVAWRTDAEMKAFAAECVAAVSPAGSSEDVDRLLAALRPAAQQDGGSVGGEELEAAARDWLCKRLSQEHPNEGHVKQLADYAAHLSALQSAHPASGAEDVGEAAIIRMADNAADAWGSDCEVVAMIEAVTDVFSKWADADLLERFKVQVEAIARQSFVEGFVRARTPQPTEDNGR